MSTNHDVSKLDDLITTLIDSVKGYDHSADKTKSESLRPLFQDLARERREVVAALQARSRALGGTPNDFGSAAATLHRRFEDLRVALGGGDAAVLSEVERGEAYLKEEFDRVLKDDAIQPETRAVVEQADATVQRGRATARAMETA